MRKGFCGRAELFFLFLFFFLLIQLFLSFSSLGISCDQGQSFVDLYQDSPAYTAYSDIVDGKKNQQYFFFFDQHCYLKKKTSWIHIP
jgi:hypothetical protein